MQQFTKLPSVRLAVALGVTALIVVFMLMPGDDSAAGRLSDLFGGTDITDALGHIGAYLIATAAWYGYFELSRPPREALSRAAILTLIVGAVVETAQSLVPDRGTQLLDYGANMLGVALFVLAHNLCQRRRDQLPTV